MWLVTGAVAAQNPPPASFPGAGITNPQPSFATAVSVDRVDGVYRERDSLRVQFGSHVESYLYLLYHTVDGKTSLMFPNGVQADNRTPPSQPVVIPPDDSRYLFRVAPPLGKEVLQVLASRHALSELDALVQPGSRAAAVPPETLSQLQVRLLSDASSWAEHRILIETVPGDAPAPRVTPARRAGLFIGIGQYRDPKISATHEELRQSAIVLHDLMLEQGGLEKEHTRLVLDQEATKANIQQLITAWLPEVSSPGDTVFIYFSGHAAKLQDAGDPTEPDGRDETIGPYDIDAGPANLPQAERLRRFRETNIVDDTLARWLQGLHGRQIVLIIDTCWSGGLVESKGLPQLMDNELARTKDIVQPNTLVLTSCASDEQSLFEGTRNKTMWFTYCLGEAIARRDKSKPLTVQAAFASAKKRMKELLREGNAGREQEPQMTDNALLPIVLVP
jgi:hypothetical protein